MTLPPAIIVPDLHDGARAWQRVANLIRFFTPDVAAVEPVGDSLEADVGRVRTALAGASEPPVVLAHGYGALLAGVAATRRNTGHLVLVAGWMLDYGETIFEVVGGPESTLATTPVELVGWRAVPATYVVATGARRITATVQRQLAATRATTIVEIDAGDQPYKTHAEALAQIVHEDLLAVRGGQIHAALRLVESA